MKTILILSAVVALAAVTRVSADEQKDLFNAGVLDDTLYHGSALCAYVASQGGADPAFASIHQAFAAATFTPEMLSDFDSQASKLRNLPLTTPYAQWSDADKAAFNQIGSDSQLYVAWAHKLGTMVQFYRLGAISDYFMNVGPAAVTAASGSTASVQAEYEDDLQVAVNISKKGEFLSMLAPNIRTTLLEEAQAEEQFDLTHTAMITFEVWSLQNGGTAILKAENAGQLTSN
jgi:hypothetical protein